MAEAAVPELTGIGHQELQRLGDREREPRLGTSIARANALGRVAVGPDLGRSFLFTKGTDWT